MKAIVSEQAEREIARLNFDVHSAISNILKCVPNEDILGLSHILISDLPQKNKKNREGAWGSYFRRWSKYPAYIEIYIKNIIGDFDRNSFQQMLPVKEIGFAYILYHEIGHHVATIRTHGIGKNKCEQYAEKYMKKIMNSYLLENAHSINMCFQNLERYALKRGLTLEAVNKMKEDWKKDYEKALTFKNSG